MPYISASAPSFEDWEAVHDAVAEAYFPHSMKPLTAGPAWHSALDVVDLGASRMTRMALGATVSVTSECPGGYAINIPLTGGVESLISGTRVESGVGQATVCPPDTTTRLPSWEPTCRLLGFRVERRFLDREYERVLARRPRPLPSQLDLGTKDGHDWMSMLRTTFDQVRGSQSGLCKDPRLTAQMSSMLVTGLLLVAMPESASDRTGTRPRIVRRVINAIEDDPGRRWTPAELAELAGVGVRRLQQGFREYVGQTPFQYLHEVRLGRAHRDLIDRDSASTVTEIALRWGFTHTGRFAADYRQRYGRSPSETLSR